MNGTGGREFQACIWSRDFEAGARRYARAKTHTEKSLGSRNERIDLVHRDRKGIAVSTRRRDWTGQDVRV